MYKNCILHDNVLFLNDHASISIEVCIFVTSFLMILYGGFLKRLHCKNTVVNITTNCSDVHHLLCSLHGGDTRN